MSNLLLFDKLTDNLSENQKESPIKDQMTKEELEESIKEEIKMILTSRNKTMHPAGTIPEAFGLPEELLYTPSEDKNEIESIISDTIELFEPRISDVRAKIIDYIPQYETAHIAISFHINQTLKKATFAFDVCIPKK